ncbi:MAG: HAMP domain-containing sensor histidine kinase [bacterium]|nr:HAMP domain-containing sensor histidine kinase [bacterium]
MSEESMRRGRAAQRLIQIRWAAVLVLFFLHAFLTQSFRLGGTEWHPALYIILGYGFLNIFLRILIGSRIERLSAGTVFGIATLSLFGDIVFLSLFSYFATDAFRPLSFALYFLTIIEAAVFFSEGMMFFVFFLSLAFYGYDAGRNVPGEVLIERLSKLIPQGFLLMLSLGFAWVLRRNLAQHTAELSQSRQLTETVVENLSDGILILDQDQRVLFINRAGERILDMKSREVLGLKIRRQTAYPIKNIANLLVIVNANTDEHGQGDARLEYPEERLLKIVRTILTDTNGSEVGHMIVMRDVTRDTFFNKMKSDFISIAAHQLRTPLSSIKWAFAMLMEEDLGKLSADQKPVVAQGLDTTDRLVRLVNSLLNVSRIEEGRFGYEFSQANVRSLVDKVMETLRPKAESRKIRVASLVPEGLGPIAADPEKIELVFENLLDNAVSYTESGGEVRIEASPEGKFVRITISDNGVGIPQSQLQLLYSKFFRGDNVIRMQTDGSGLGLYIAKNIVERHGGTIALTSQEGAGTTVSFTVPFAQ